MPFEFQKLDGSTVTLPTGLEDSSYESYRQFTGLMREKYYVRVPGIDRLVPRESANDLDLVEHWQNQTKTRKQKKAYAASLSPAEREKLFGNIPAWQRRQMGIL